MSFPNLTFWSNLLGTVGIEVCAVVALGVAAQCAFRRAYWQRAMWQMTLICLLLISASEWTGAGRGAVWSLLGPKRETTAGVPMTLSPNVEILTFKGAYAISPPLPPQKKAVWWPGWLWLAGTVIVLGRMATAQCLLLVLRFRRKKIVDGILQERVNRVAKMVGLRRRICLLRLPETISPMAFGILFPTIGLPPGFETGFSAMEQDAILAHELAHLAVLDPLWFRLADFASALLWWHPLAWWARRSLQGASELAADEATALVADGPGSLANCLVGLGKKMTLAHGWGWVGINGEFRSKLGKRVERLTRMPGKLGRPFVSWTDTLTRIAVAILIVPSAILLLFAAFQTAHGDSENGWRESWNSSPGALLVMAALDTSEQPKPEDAGRADKTAIAHRVQDAKLLYEMGKLAEAKAILKRVLKDDPSNKTAAYYLNMVKVAEFMNRARKREALAKSAILDVELDNPMVPNPIVTNGLVYTTQGRQAILSKLDRIRLNEVQYDLPLTEVLNQLRIESQKRDPTGGGVNFLFNPHLDAAAGGYLPDDMTGTAPVGAIPFTAPTPSMDLSGINIKISPTLRDVRLVDVLNAITKAADHPIKYTVEDYAVVFSPKPAEAIPLYSKVYHLDPNTFVKSLMQVSGINSGDSAPDTDKPTNGKPMDDGPRRADDDHDSLGGPTSAGSEVRLNFVTRTNSTVVLDTMVRNYFTMAGVDLTAPGKSVFVNDRRGLLLVRATAKDLQRIEQAVAELNQMPPQVAIEAQFVELSQQEAKALGFENFVAADETNSTSVMSPSEYDAAIKAIRQNTHEDILPMPKVTTLSGRQMHIAAQDLQKIGTGATTTTVAVGPVIDIISTIAADGYSIETLLIPTYTEFLQNDPSGKFAPSASGNQTGTPVAATLPLPHFRARQVVSSCEAMDGQTLVTGQLASDKPSGPKKLQLYFVTPRIIDPAGNWVHSDKELSGKR